MVEPARPYEAARESGTCALVVDGGGVLAAAMTRMLVDSGLRAVRVTVDDAELTAPWFRPAALVVDDGGRPEALEAIVVAVRQQVPAVRVVLVSTDVAAASDLATSLGADACLDLHVTPDELISALRGTRPARPAAARVQRRSQPPKDSRVTRLTPREREVLAMLMGGCSAEDMAGHMGISPHTVRTHIHNLLGKLNVRTRLEAASVGFREGVRAYQRPSAQTPAAP